MKKKLHIDFKVRNSGILNFTTDNEGYKGTFETSDKLNAFTINELRQDIVRVLNKLIIDKYLDCLTPKEANELKKMDSLITKNKKGDDKK